MTNITAEYQGARIGLGTMSSSSLTLPLFDPAAVEKLRKVAGDLDPGFVAEMAQLFLTETERALGELEAAAERGDASAMARQAHSMKSSAATLGLMKLSHACLSLETQAKNEAGPDASALVTMVRAQFDHVTPILKKLA